MCNKDAKRLRSANAKIIVRDGMILLVTETHSGALYMEPYMAVEVGLKLIAAANMVDATSLDLK